VGGVEAVDTVVQAKHVDVGPSSQPNLEYGGAMRNVVAISVACIAGSVSCGGGSVAGGGVQSPDTSVASAGTPAASAVAPPMGSPGAATTTAPLADVGDTQGTKLAETQSPALPAASGGSSPRPSHAHEAGRGPSDIRAIVVAHRDEARACYDQALSEHPGIEGDLVVGWTIDPKGNVGQTALDASRSQITEPTLVACISDIIKRMQFAVSPGGFETKAFYPFNFHPRHGRPTQ
jgi:hypothetical protein